MYKVGPYEFTKLDARTTFGDLADLWREHLIGFPELPAAVEQFVDEWADATADHIATAAGQIIDPASPVTRLDAAGKIAEQCVASGAWTDAQVADVLSVAWLGLRDVADALRDAGLFGGPSSGTVVQLNRSGGGVPKLPLPVVDVDWGGVVGDVQVNRRHHGRPFQALCLWDADVIDRFASEGHPIGYGSAGENVTVRGLDWRRVRPGVRLRLGTVRCEVSSYAVPCSQNAGWFVGRAFNRCTTIADRSAGCTRRCSSPGASPPATTPCSNPEHATTESQLNEAAGAGQSASPLRSRRPPLGVDQRRGQLDRLTRHLPEHGRTITVPAHRVVDARAWADRHSEHLEVGAEPRRRQAVRQQPCRRAPTPLRATGCTTRRRAAPPAVPCAPGRGGCARHRRPPATRLPRRARVVPHPARHRRTNLRLGANADTASARSTSEVVVGRDAAGRPCATSSPMATTNPAGSSAGDGHTPRMSSQRAAVTASARDPPWPA